MPQASDEFEELLERYARLMGSAIRRVCGRKHRDLIPDVEQEVRLALWKRLQGGERIAHPISYLHKVALTTALAVVRRHEREETTMDGEIEPASAPPPGRGELLPPEIGRLLEQAFEQLPLEQTRALRAYLAGFNHLEVAKLYGWSESAARHRIYRGLEALRRRLGEPSRKE